MKNVTKAILGAAALIILSAAISYTQTGVGDWQHIQDLRPKTNLIVETKDGQEIAGRFTSATSSVLTATIKGRSIAIDRDSIESVYLARKGSRLKRALRGAAIGGLVGVGTLSIYTVATKSDPLTAVAGLYGVPAGAVIGAASRSNLRKGELIYRSQ